MRHVRVICGAILLVALTAGTCFSEAETVASVPYIGEVRKLKDASGRETDYFIRITKDSIAQEKISEAQKGVRGQIEKYLALLEKEDDPDVRRHYLYRIGAAPGLEARLAIDRLKQGFDREPEEDVRVAAISCLATLAANAGLADNHILNVIDFIGARAHSDPSPNVRLNAANTISWFGGKDDVITVIEKFLLEKENVCPNILGGLPATLQRINKREATELLLQIAYGFEGDYVATDALWRLHQMSLVEIDAVIESAKNIAHKSPEEKSRIKAIYLMGTIARENPSKADSISETIKSIENQEDKGLQRAIDSTLEEMGVTAAPLEPSAVDYDRQAVYDYTARWYDSANHTCGYKISPPEGMKRGDVLIYHSGGCDSWSAHATVVVNANGSDVRIAGHSAPQWDTEYTYLQNDMPYYEFLQHPGGDTPEPIAKVQPWILLLLNY